MPPQSEDAQPEPLGSLPERVLAPFRKQTQSDFEVEFFGSILERSADFVDVLRCQGELLSRKGLHEQALEIDRRLARLVPHESVVLYNFACSLSRNELADEALAVLRQALQQGYDDFEYMELDGDFDTLRADARFVALVAEFCPHPPKRRVKKQRRKS